MDVNMDVFWNIDTDLETIRVAVHAKAAVGWAGFGVSEMGGMEGADIVFYEVSVSQVQHFLFGSNNRSTPRLELRETYHCSHVHHCTYISYSDIQYKYEIGCARI